MNNLTLFIGPKNVQPEFLTDLLDLIKRRDFNYFWLDNVDQNVGDLIFNLSKISRNDTVPTVVYLGQDKKVDKVDNSNYNEVVAHTMEPLKYADKIYFYKPGTDEKFKLVASRSDILK